MSKQKIILPKQWIAVRDRKTKKKTTFSSSYYCCDFLPKQIILEKLQES